MNVPCAQFTTLGIGGSARYFVRAETEDAVIRGLEFAEENKLPVFILGGGSNVLIADAGFEGLVLQIALRGIEMSEPPAVAGGLTWVNEISDGPNTRLQPPATAGGSDFVTARAGEDWDGFVTYCVENDLAGVECLSGIPGFVGGTPVQNVGAYGQEVAETIVSVRCFDRRTKKIVALANADCGFSYRTSIFNSSERDRYVVLSVTLALEKGGEPKVSYKDLIEQFGYRRPTLNEVRDAVLRIRRSKSMVIDPNDPNSRSAGSFFKNPIVSRRYLAELQTKFEHIPFFEFGEAVKIPAAWLIENAGFQKGFARGNARISTNHTLAIVNRGATAAEVVALMTEIQHGVETKFGILLQPEPVMIGF